MIYQPSLFAHINSRCHAFKSEVLKDSHCEIAQFWATCMIIIQMVILIRATRKTPLNCMAALSVCLVANVHSTRSQHLRTICSCVTDNTHNFFLIRIADASKEFLEQNGFSMSQSLVLCLRNAFDITFRQTINRLVYRLQQLESRFVLQMEWCITHHTRAQYVETTLHCTEMKYSVCSDAK